MQEDFIKELGYLGFATRLKRLSDSLMQEGRRLYQGLAIDIEPNWYLIFTILKKYGQLSVTEIADRLQLAHPSIITITNKMERAGYLVSAKSEADNRRRVLELSAKAEQRLPEFERIWDAGTKAVEETLEEIQVLQTIEQMEAKFFSKGFRERTLNQLKSVPTI